VNEESSHRFRFTLRTLLLVVGVCGAGVAAGLYVSRLPPYEVRQIQLGMSRAEIGDRLGNSAIANWRYEMECWTYSYKWGVLNIYWHYEPHDSCFFIEYARHSENGAWHLEGADGRRVEYRQH